jgi:hypothetical protein
MTLDAGGTIAMVFALSMGAITVGFFTVFWLWHIYDGCDNYLRHRRGLPSKKGPMMDRGLLF